MFDVLIGGLFKLTLHCINLKVGQDDITPVDASELVDHFYYYTVICVEFYNLFVYNFEFYS